MSTDTVISISSAIAAILSAFFAWLVVCEAKKQNSLSHKAIQAQTFLMVINIARELQFSKGMDIIRRLNYRDYGDFKSNEPKETQEQIRTVVDFLNDLMHLIEHGYITKEQVTGIYYISIITCSEHLLPWWVNGFRKEQGSEYYYLSFESLCDKVQSKKERANKQGKKKNIKN
jgi:ABC-type nickel/cobalt efflux system permease component RcnA